MYAPSFRLASFDVIPEGYKFTVLDHLLEALTMANVAYLLTHPGTPLLYESGVRYELEPDGRDEWQDIPDTIARRTGDCEDLACWRVAELRVAGEIGTTRAISIDELPDRSGKLVTTFHICVLRQDRSVEDPSRRLGM
jgi:hypothetical protein